MHSRLGTAVLLAWCGTSWSSEILPNPSFEILTGNPSSRYAVEWYGVARPGSLWIFVEPGPENESRLGLMLASSPILVLATVVFCFRPLLFPSKFRSTRPAPKINEV